MKLKKAISFILTLCMSLSTMLVNAGAEGEEASYTLTVSPVTIVQPGESQFLASVSDLQFGTVHTSEGDLQTQSLRINYFAADPSYPDNWERSGSLSDGNGNTLSFLVGRNHAAKVEPAVVITPETGMTVGFDMLVYIDPAEWAAAVPGTYTGNMYYLGEWICEDNYQVSTQARTIGLTAVVPEAGESHEVHIDSLNNGSITADPVSGTEGTIVTLTVTPAAGYELDGKPVVYQYADGSITTSTVSTEKTGDNTYTFVMPSTDVLVMAEFRDMHPLTVNGTKVTPANASNILGDGKVSYDPATATLAMNGADIPASDIYSPSIVLSGEGMNLTITGNGTIHGGISAQNSTVTLNGNIIVKTVNPAIAASELVVSGGTVWINTNTHALNINKLTLQNNVQLRKPADGYFSYNHQDIMIDDSHEAEDVVFSDSEVYTVDIENYNGVAEVTVDKEVAAAGDTVSFTAVPGEGFLIDTVYCQKSNYDTFIPDYDNENNSWSFTMPENDLTLRVVLVDETKTWENLQKRINDGIPHMLYHDVTAGTDDSALIVESGKNMSLDLNGHTIDRGLGNSSAVSGGNVFTVNGSLTITDSQGSGVITGGNNTGSGGGITVNAGGTLTLSGGTVTGNHSGQWGGGVYLGQSESAAATMNLDGGKITDNTCVKNGGGIHVSERAVLNVSGDPEVSGNTKGNVVNNVNLANGALIHVTDTLDGASIGVSVSADYAPTSGSPRPFTQGLSGKGNADNFTVDNNAYPVRMIDGEANLVKLGTVIVSESEHGTVTSDKTAADEGETVTLTPVPDENYALYSLTVTDGETTADLTDHDDGTYSFLMPVNDVTVTAVFRLTKPVYINGPFEHGTVTADKTAAMAGETITLTVTPEEGYILDTLTILSRMPYGGTDVTITPEQGENGIWTFIMPGDERIAYVSATFKWEKLPPEGNLAANISIMNTITGGTVTGSTGGGTVIPVGDHPVSLSNVTVYLTVTPDEGNVLKEITVRSYTNEVYSQQYSLPVLYGPRGYYFEVGSYDVNPLWFQINAVFEEAPQPYTIKIENWDTADTGCTISTDKGTGPVYAGDTVTITANLTEGYTFAYQPSSGDEERVRYPKAWYKPSGTDTGTEKVIELTKNSESEYTFIVPDDIDPNYAYITLEAVYDRAEYAVIVDTPSVQTVGVIETDKQTAFFGDTVNVDVKVAKNAAFDPAEGFTVFYQSEGITTYVNTSCQDPQGTDGGVYIHYEYTFAMPSHDVHIEAVITSPEYMLTVAKTGPDTGGKPSVTITVNDLEINPTYMTQGAEEGDTVKLFINTNTDAGHDLNGVRKVTCEWKVNGEKKEQVLDLTYNEIGNVRCSFTMPAADTTIVVNYERAYIVSWTDNTMRKLDTKQIKVLPGEQVIITRTILNEAFAAIADFDWGVSSAEYTVDPDDPNKITFEMPESDVLIRADYFLPYVKRSWNGSQVVEEAVTCTDGTALSAVTDGVLSGSCRNGIYVLDQDLTFNDTLAAEGDVCLILRDGFTLTAKGGIDIRKDSTLTICFQENETGTIIAKPDEGPGIESKDEHTSALVICGGIIDAEGDSSDAGIGGKSDHSNGPITIYGGTITAKGGKNAAGIGTGNDRNAKSPITIYGGTITAKGGKNAAGIGAGNNGSHGDITIYGGKIDAIGGEMGAGIGNGYKESGGGTITFYGGEVYARTTFTTDNTRRERNACGVGGGGWEDDEHGHIGGSPGDIHFYGGYVKGEGRYGIGGDGWHKSVYGDDMCVKDNGKLLKAKDRKDTYSWQAIVYPCEHTQRTYTVSETGHTASCKHCKTKFSEQQHTYGSDNKCTVCGHAYQGTLLTVSFVANGGSGTMDPVSVVPGMEYLLPECGFIAEAGKSFSGWQIGEIVYAVEDTITVNEDTTVKAVWGTTYTVAFEKGDEGAEGEMEAVTKFDGDTYELPECGFTAPEGKAFKEWSVKTGDTDAVTKKPGEDITVTADTIVMAVWEVPAEAPEFKTKSLVLSGQIGLSFNMSLPDLQDVDYTTSYMTFAIEHGPVPERVDYSASGTKSSGNRSFVAYINSIQMSEPVTATFHYIQGGKEKTVETEYSVKDYFIEFDELVEKDPGLFDQETKDLVHALADYGHYVQPFLSDARGWKLDTDYEELGKHYTDSYDYEAVKSAVSGYIVEIDNNTDGDIKAISYSLTLDSDTIINVYFKPAGSFDNTFTASVDGATAEWSKDTKGRYCVKISGISAHRLSKKHTVSVTTAEGHTAAVTVCALSYVDSALNYYTGTSDKDVHAKNAVSAFYAYSQAADAYKPAHPDN